MNAIEQNLKSAFASAEFPEPSYRGKVRDVFERGNELIMVTTDRVSVFDQVVGTIPLKGALLTEQSTFWLRKASDIVETHLIAREDAQIQRCKKATPFLFETIVRGYLTGSLLREPAHSRGHSYGLRIDPSLAAFDRFETPLLTPTTKAVQGQHDEAISQSNIVACGLASHKQMDFINDVALQLFALGSAFAQERGLILVDTKYEFGLLGDHIILIDEVHTADSSRYWMAGTYNERRAKGQDPDMLDKERLRRTLITMGVDPKGNSPIPPLSEAMRIDLAKHYWQLTETLTGETFVPPAEPAATRVADWLKRLA